MVRGVAHGQGASALTSSVRSVGAGGPPAGVPPDGLPPNGWAGGAAVPRLMRSLSSRASSPPPRALVCLYSSTACLMMALAPCGKCVWGGGAGFEHVER